MTDQTTTDLSVIHNTFVVERQYGAAPERVFAAFADTAKKRRWYGESDSHEVEQFEMDFRVGGREHIAYRLRRGTPFPGVMLTNDSVFQDIVPDRRLVMSATMALGGKRISAVLETFQFVPADGGCKLVLTHQGAFFEGSGGAQIREDGWRKLFERLEQALSD